MFVKSGPNPPGEAAGLRWLAAAMTHGGAQVARVYSVDTDRLEIEYIDEASPSRERARAFGRDLARTHAAGASWWGCPPHNWNGPAWVGRSHTPLVLHQEDAQQSWGAFYATCRIAPFARRLQDSGALSAVQAEIFTSLGERLWAGDFDSEQPRLVREAGHEVARVHGDMWAGNVLYTESSAALIDPMAHGGHAETDLATLSVFGFPFLDEVYAGYDEHSPFADGWHDRIALHELGIVIMHADLFGGGYLGAALERASRYI